VLELSAYVYSTIGEIKHVLTTTTLLNPHGVIALSQNEATSILCCPAEMNDRNELGLVQIWDLDNIDRGYFPLSAHNSPISALALNYDGNLLATASEKGTLLRVFNTRTGDMVQELRRGSENVTIYAISFHIQCDWLACISDSGTVHIFSLATQTAHKEQQVEEQFYANEYRKSEVSVTNSKNPKSMYIYQPNKVQFYENI